MGKLMVSEEKKVNVASRTGSLIHVSSTNIVGLAIIVINM